MTYKKAITLVAFALLAPTIPQAQDRHEGVYADIDVEETLSAKGMVTGTTGASAQ